VARGQADDLGPARALGPVEGSSHTAGVLIGGGAHRLVLRLLGRGVMGDGCWTTLGNTKLREGRMFAYPGHVL
jgi:hypothetical protein